MMQKDLVDICRPNSSVEIYVKPAVCLERTENPTIFFPIIELLNSC